MGLFGLLLRQRGDSPHLVLVFYRRDGTITLVLLRAIAGFIHFVGWIRRKVRSPQGGVPANGRAGSLKAIWTDSATENVPLPAYVGSKGEKVR